MTRRDGSKRRSCAQVTVLTPGRVLSPLLQAVVPPAEHPPPCLGPRRAGVQLTALSVPSPLASNLAHANCVGGNPSVFDRSAGREPCENHAGVLWHVRTPCFRVHSQVLPLLRHLSPGRRNRPKGRNVGSRTALQAFSVPGHPRKGGSWATQGSMPSYARGRFSAPSPPFLA